MKQYLNILSEIISTGIEKESGRANMPNTIGISKSEIVMNLQDGFPLLTTKKMYWKVKCCSYVQRIKSRRMPS